MQMLEGLLSNQVLEKIIFAVFGYVLSYVLKFSHSFILYLARKTSLCNIRNAYVGLQVNGVLEYDPMQVEISKSIFRKNMLDEYKVRFKNSKYT